MLALNSWARRWIALDPTNAVCCDAGSLGATDLDPSDPWASRGLPVGHGAHADRLDRGHVFEHTDGDWWAECLVCRAWVSTSNATERDAERKFGRHLQHDHAVDERPIATLADAASQRFPCPCCGHLVFVDGPGSYEIRPVCWWEDDLVQLRWPDLRGGANGPSLREAQEHYRRIGASDPRLLAHVRSADVNEQLDPAWRPFDETRDPIEQRVSGVDYGNTYAIDRTAYYYWRRRPR